MPKEKVVKLSEKAAWLYRAVEVVRDAQYLGHKKGEKEFPYTAKDGSPWFGVHSKFTSDAMRKQGVSKGLMGLFLDTFQDENVAGFIKAQGELTGHGLLRTTAAKGGVQMFLAKDDRGPKGKAENASGSLVAFQKMMAPSGK